LSNSANKQILLTNSIETIFPAIVVAGPSLFRCQSMLLLSGVVVHPLLLQCDHLDRCSHTPVVCTVVGQTTVDQRSSVWGRQLADGGQRTEKYSWTVRLYCRQRRRRRCHSHCRRHCQM